MFESKWKRKLEETRDWADGQQIKYADWSTRDWSGSGHPGDLKDTFWEMSRVYGEVVKNIDARLRSE